MTLTLAELCRHVQKCTERLEEETKKNIENCHKVLLSKEATEVKLALEKAKDYHYKEILDYLKGIITNIRKIVFHDEKIRALNDEKALSLDELKRYSHVQRQISIFSNFGEVTKREKRRVASEISVGSLEAWENYLEKKAEEEKIVQTEKSELQKRKRPNSKRRKKKFVSSTFNNFLDDKGENRKLHSILEDSTQEDDLRDKLTEDYVVVSTENLALESDHHDMSSLGKNPLQQVLDDVDKLSFGSRTKQEDLDTNLKEEEEIKKDDEDKEISNGEVLHDTTDNKPRIVDVIYKSKKI